MNTGNKVVSIGSEIIFNSVNYNNKENELLNIISIQPWWNSIDLARIYAFHFIHDVDLSTLETGEYVFIYDRFTSQGGNDQCKFLSFIKEPVSIKDDLINFINQDYNNDDNYIVSIGI